MFRRVSIPEFLTSSITTVAFMETVEETFGIKIPESAIVTQKFDSFDDIIKIIISEKGE